MNGQKEMCIVKYNARSFFRLGQAGSIFGLALLELKGKYPLKVLSSDMSVVAGLDRYKRQYPEDFYNVGIAEQNLVGVSAGLASEGFLPVAVAQAAFISMRSYEQLRQYMGYMSNKIVAVGINSGFALTFFGNTHYGIEDLSLLRSIPGMTVLSPSDAGSAVKAFEASMDVDGPVYIRLTGGLNCPIIYKDDFAFKVGKAVDLLDGDEIVIISTGSITSNVLTAAGILEEMGHSARVVDMLTVKPIDKESVLSARNARIIVTVEEHNTVGGLGSAVADILAETGGMPPLLKLGVRDKFLSVGDYSYLIDQVHLTPQGIVDDILANIQ